MIRSFAGDRETVDGGIHVDNFKLGMTMAFRYCMKRFVPPEKLFRDWNVVIAAHLNDPTFESGSICRLGGDFGSLFCMMSSKEMLDHQTHSPKNLENIYEKEERYEKKQPRETDRGRVVRSSHEIAGTAGGKEMSFRQVHPGAMEGTDSDASLGASVQSPGRGTERDFDERRFSGLDGA